MGVRQIKQFPGMFEWYGLREFLFLIGMIPTSQFPGLTCKEALLLWKFKFPKCFSLFLFAGFVWAL
jgi:hypothetical protein